VDVDHDLDVGTQICNQGVVHWDSDNNGTNDSETRTDDPTTDADGDPTCVTLEEPVGPLPLSGTIDAPTLSQWGMILASCLFALAFAWHGFRRRRVSAT
jgi:exosortase sorting signal-containing protein